MKTYIFTGHIDLQTSRSFHALSGASNELSSLSRARARLAIRHAARRHVQVRALLDPATIGVACTASISRILVGIPYRTLGRHLTRVVRPTGPLSLVCRLSPATVWENKRLCLSESGAPSLCKSTHPGLLCWLNTVFFVGRLCIARWALFMGQSGRHGRLWSRTQQALNPIGAMQLVLIFTLIGAALAAARQYLLYNVRQCRSCRGFGIQRCILCGGTGKVGWEAKYSHEEPCPRCLGRRFVNCRECGGLYHRPIFQHCSLELQAGEGFYARPAKMSSKLSKTPRKQQVQDSAALTFSVAKAWED